VLHARLSFKGTRADDAVLNVFDGTHYDLKRRKKREQLKVKEFPRNETSDRADVEGAARR
jgi:hypothetical protein